MTQHQHSTQVDDGAATELTATQCLDTLRALQQQAEEDELDRDEVQRISHALLMHFQATPDASIFEEPLEGPRMVAEFAASHLGSTIPTLNSRQLEEILFELLPAKVSARADIARNVIETLKALYVWLGREFSLEQAHELIELLGEDAVRELERRMDDPANYGPAKAMVMEALASGVDLSDRQAIEAFMRSRIGTRPGSGFEAPSGDGYDDYNPFPRTSAPPLSAAQQKARQQKRKKDRKAARKARKKNR